MTDTTTALHLNLDGQIREYDLGSDREQQHRVIGRALLDNVEVVERIEWNSGPSILMLARVHRAGEHLNFSAGLALDILGLPTPALIEGDVLFVGYSTETRQITGLPDDAAALIRQASPQP
ncbi:hypothetical protein ACFW6V_29065 [Streptomyces sp. NPDC058734]|uniref:hypothetical protein n=1 Tax=Streptomyces sp. NPDC058734 TaxID=3346615 RepID=UPI0036979C7B